MDNFLDVQADMTGDNAKLPLKLKHTKGDSITKLPFKSDYSEWTYVFFKIVKIVS